MIFLYRVLKVDVLLQVFVDTTCCWRIEHRRCLNNVTVVEKFSRFIDLLAFYIERSFHRQTLSRCTSQLCLNYSLSTLDIKFCNLPLHMEIKTWFIAYSVSNQGWKMKRLVCTAFDHNGICKLLVKMGSMAAKSRLRACRVIGALGPSKFVVPQSNG